ncbi:glycosyltransferase family 2 protein [Adhaeribacter pallidiroseus]|uniref:Lipopolysaccharide core biosynthesis glycosyltransferase KdtX n=1 Tax=Adhaeribacter pallidiroseus TaxID=2072847 RepID=A0A369QMD9_9BACT|nr:glycosyltransferase family 2 protein [Adhaeribacter pallidiroseus]RDC66101.1 Lipopolysaccharide core biosynthesis glycosyltransferase KdtX [Adhaeribacter pallidiroseus]
MISVIILTKNEEKDIPLCLTSLHWCDDVHVLDSGSTDKTIEIAKQFEAKVWNNVFESFGKQRNYALDHISSKHNWILFLDADEIVTDKFKLAMYEAINIANIEVAGFYCCWKMMLEGKWLKHCDNFPKWQFRLMRKSRARFTDFGHGQKEDKVDGQIKYIKEPYLHFGFSKGWYQWIERHNKYSTLEAVARLQNPQSIKNIFARHGSVRNQALRSWLSKLPGWPFLRFFHAYFLNFGFLEGIPGLIYCTNMGYYEFLIQIKIRELSRNRVNKK